MAKQQTALTIPAPSALTAPLGLEGVKESEDLIIPRKRQGWHFPQQRDRDHQVRGAVYLPASEPNQGVLGP